MRKSQGSYQKIYIKEVKVKILMKVYRTLVLLEHPQVTVLPFLQKILHVSFRFKREAIAYNSNTLHLLKPHKFYST